VRTGLIVKKAKLHINLYGYTFSILLGLKRLCSVIFTPSLWKLVNVLSKCLNNDSNAIPEGEGKHASSDEDSQTLPDQSLDESLKNKKLFDGTLPSEQLLKDKILRGEDPYLEFITEARERTFPEWER
jgi:hypothetical protein